MKPSECPPALQRLLEQALHNKDFDAMKLIMAEINKHQAAQFRRDMQQRIKLLTRYE